MSTPAPIRIIKSWLEKTPFPVMSIGVVFFVPLLLMGVYVDAFNTSGHLGMGEDPLEIPGLYALLAVMPAYLMMCLAAAIRSSENVHASLMQLLSASEREQHNRYRLVRYWPVMLILGVTIALRFNVGWESLEFEPDSPRYGISIGIVFGQVFLWSIVGVLLSFSFNESVRLHQLGKCVQVDIFSLEELNGFGRTALNGFLMVVGALALTVVQSIGGVFRLEYYMSALLLCIPAIFFVVLVPIWSIHRRIKREKEAQLLIINGEVSSTSKGLDSDSLLRLNSLLQRREQLQTTRTWPMDLSIFTRFVLYVFIPPLAWIGAALMEVYLDSFLVG